MKASSQGLIQELRNTCRKSLHNGNAIGIKYAVNVPERDSDKDQKFPSKRRRHVPPKSIRTWETILIDIVEILPSLTDHEYSQVLKYVSIMLLGFLLPNSSGNEFFLLQNLSTREFNSQDPDRESQWRDDAADTILDLSLEERVESTPFKYTSTENRKSFSITEEHVDVAFFSFLQNCLGPLLRGRPIHTRQVDLVHVIAMAIHPQPSEQPIRSSVSDLEERDNQYWSRAKGLMNSLAPLSFNIHYGHRLRLVKLVADNLVLPEKKKEQESRNGPLFDGALHHLRASLYAFGMSAMDAVDAHWSQCGLVSIAVQSGNTKVVREEWGRLLNRLMDDSRHYDSCPDTAGAKPTFSLMNRTGKDMCLHTARGQLLERFLTQFSESRHYADNEFLQFALSSLADAIEFKVDSWAVESGDTDEGDAENAFEKESSNDVVMKESAFPEDEKADTTETSQEPPSILSSLLFAAKSIFYFLLSPSSSVGKDIGDDEEESEESQRRDMLISCGIQLLHHSNSGIANEASKLLVLAFSHGSDEMMADYAGAIFESAKLVLQNSGNYKWTSKTTPVEGMLAYFSTRSRVFGEGILSLLLDLGDESSEDEIMKYRLIAAIATACPSAARNHRSNLVQSLDRGLAMESKAHILVALLACRRTHFFNKDETSTTELFRDHALQGISGWNLYLLARHALVSGDYESSSLLYSELLFSVSSEQSFLWLTGMQQVAEAESLLLSHGGKGITNAIMILRNIISTFLSTAAFSRSGEGALKFQVEVLQLRVDFLDLLCTIRQLTNEMRLTSVGPKKFTRPSLHLQSAVKLLNLLGSRYLSLYRQYGLFICQQSRTTLRTLHSLCRFVSSASRSTFIDDLPPTSSFDFQKDAIKALSVPRGDSSHPCKILMDHMDSVVLKDMKGSIDAKVRAAALLQIIDNVLRVPSPFPRSFLHPRSFPKSKLEISLDPDSFDYPMEGEEGNDEDVHLSVGTTFSLVASGAVSNQLMHHVGITFHVILVWYRMIKKNTSDLGQDSKQDDELASNSDVRSLSSSMNFSTIDDSAPITTRMSPSGTFFAQFECEAPMEAGSYDLDMVLGCRDIRGGQWELPLAPGSHSIGLRVSRSG